jgi:hypothetical protein
MINLCNTAGEHLVEIQKNACKTRREADEQAIQFKGGSKQFIQFKGGSKKPEVPTGALRLQAMQNNGWSCPTFFGHAP